MHNERIEQMKSIIIHKGYTERHKKVGTSERL